jgi:heavy metal efflux system protein
MIGRIVALSIAHRWAVVLVCVAAVASGAWSLARLPIDAVPDITNNQVQINTIAAALSPVEIEKQVTFRIETALAGTPGLEYTRSLSRNGFSQVTAVFSDKTNIYFARQQLSERLLDVRSTLPPGAEPRMGPVSTGLGEIYMWTIALRLRTSTNTMASQAGKRMAHIARLRASVSSRRWNGLRICEQYRTGLFDRRSRAYRV